MAATTAQPDTGQLLADLKTTVGAIQGGDWMTAGMDAGNTSLDSLGAVASPLSSVAQAGFGFIMPLVSFLEEPLKQLEGNPSSVSSSSQGMQGAGANVGSLGENYQQAAGTQTSGWSGGAADGYQQLSQTMTSGISAIGQAGTALAGAATGAGAAVSQTTEQVSQLITEAAGQIISTLTKAFASAQATFGASVVAAIPQCVQTAVQYGQQIMAKMQTLLSSSQNLAGLVEAVLKAVDEVDQVLMKLIPGGGSSGQSGTGTSTDSGTGTGGTGTQTVSDQTGNGQSQSQTDQAQGQTSQSQGGQGQITDQSGQTGQSQAQTGQTQDGQTIDVDVKLPAGSGKHTVTVTA